MPSVRPFTEKGSVQSNDNTNCTERLPCGMRVLTSLHPPLPFGLGISTTEFVKVQLHRAALMMVMTTRTGPHNVSVAHSVLLLINFFSIYFIIYTCAHIYKYVGIRIARTYRFYATAFHQ